jgi:hypothetical protein
VEVFGAMPDSERFGQVVLLPETAEAEARALAYGREGARPAPEFDWLCRPGAQSYEILALIPLEALAIEEGADRFMLEVSVYGSPVDVPHRERLFGSTRPASTTGQYGRMKVVE